MTGFIYGLAVLGFIHAKWPFWEAMIWPYYLAAKFPNIVERIDDER